MRGTEEKRTGVWEKGRSGEKYLLVRRDGTIVEEPHFVLEARNPAALAALRAYADLAEEFGHHPGLIDDARRRADEFERWREESDARDPHEPAFREDDPEIVRLMTEGGRVSPPRRVLTPRQARGLVTVLRGVASWTASRWDQHLRWHVGDDDAGAVIRWLDAETDGRDDLALPPAELLRARRNAPAAIAPPARAGHADAARVTEVDPAALPAGTRGARAWIVFEEGERQTMLLALAPGGVLGKHRHDNDRETCVVLRGSMDLSIDEGAFDSTCLLKVRGESEIPAGTRHSVRAHERGALVACWLAPETPEADAFALRADSAERPDALPLAAARDPDGAVTVPPVRCDVCGVEIADDGECRVLDRDVLLPTSISREVRRTCSAWCERVLLLEWTRLLDDAAERTERQGTAKLRSASAHGKSTDQATWRAVGLVTGPKGILLVRHRDRGWELPGLVEAGEGVVEKILEETGIDTIPDGNTDTEILGGWTTTVPRRREFTLVLRFRPRDPFLRPRPADPTGHVVEARWFSPSVVPRDSLSPVRSASVVRRWADCEGLS